MRVADLPAPSSGPRESSQAMAYTALIRTRDSHPLVERVVQSLRRQGRPPASIVAVDSGSDPSQRHLLEPLVDRLVDYPAEPFNYSKAINIGVAHCATPYVLIISSHVVLRGADLVGRAIDEMQRVGALGFYFWNNPAEDWTSEIVRRENFDGHNGLHNTCAFLPAAAVVARPFREEVFSAEDQEWAAHHLREHGSSILRIGTRDVENLNPRVNHRKFVNEEVSIAYFTCRERLALPYLASWLVRAAVAFVRGRRGRSLAHLQIFRELTLARLRPPRRESRYY